MSGLFTTTLDSEARFVNAEGDPQFAGFKLTRQWEKIHASNADELMAALNDTEIYTDPKADKETHSGTFVNTRIDPAADGEDAIVIKQTLTKVKSTTDSDDADLVNMEGDPKVGGSTINRAWHYINPTASDSLYTTLNGITSYSSGVKANKQLYSGRYVVSRITPVEEKDRTVTINQKLTKVFTVGAVDSLGNLPDPLIDRERDIVHPFGVGTGVRTGVIYRYLNLDPSGDTTLNATSDTKFETIPGDSHSFVSRKITTEDNRTSTLWILFRDYTRLAWTDTTTQSPDHIITSNKSRQFERKTEKWYGFDRDDRATALANLEDSSKVDSGYNALGVEYVDNDDQSVDYTREIIKESTDTRTDSAILSPHSVEYVAVQDKITKYRNYRNEPIDPSIDTGFDFIEADPEMDDGTGLIRLDHKQRKVIPSNTVDTAGNIARSQTRGWDNFNGSSDIDSVGKAKSVIYDRIPIDSAVKAVRVQSSNDTEYVSSSVHFSDLGDGSARLFKKMIKVNTEGNFYIESAREAVGGSSAYVWRVWPKVWDTYADVLLDTSGDTNAKARNNFDHKGKTYSHYNYHRTRHFDKTSTVRQVGKRSSVRFTFGSSESFPIDPYSIHWDYITDTGNGNRNHVKVTTSLEETSSASTADTWAGASHRKNGAKMGRVQYRGDGKYWAYKVKVSAP